MLACQASRKFHGNFANLLQVKHFEIELSGMETAWHESFEQVLHVGKGCHNSGKKKKFQGGVRCLFRRFRDYKKAPGKIPATTLSGGFDIAASIVRIWLLAWELPKERLAALAAGRRAIISVNPFQIA